MDDVRKVYTRLEVITATGAKVDLPIFGGSVSYNPAAAETWNVSSLATDIAYEPHDPSDMLDLRSGSLLRIYWGTTYPEESEQVLCTVVPTGYSVSGGSLKLNCADLTWLADRAGYGGATLDVSGVSTSVALTRLMEQIKPLGGFDVAAGGEPVPDVYILGLAAPKEDWKELCKVAGYQQETDELGVIHFGLKPAGRYIEIERLVSRSRSVDYESMSNRIVVVSTNQDILEPITSVAEAPGSAVRLETRIESEAISSQGSADNMAAMQLGRLQYPYLKQTIEIQSRPDLRAFDRLDLPTEGIWGGLWQVHSWSMGLAGGPMKVELEGIRA